MGANVPGPYHKLLHSDTKDALVQGQLKMVCVMIQQQGNSVLTMSIDRGISVQIHETWIELSEHKKARGERERSEDQQALNTLGGCVNNRRQH